MKTLRFSIVLATAVLGLSACSGTSMAPTAAASAGGEEPANFQLVTDVPIPSGATRDNERTLILSYRDRWVGRVVMKLWKTAPEATQFYQQQMPNFGWEPVMSVASTRSVLAYLRGDRAATIEIEPGAMWGSTVSVTVGPREAAPGAGAAPTGGAAWGVDPPAARSAAPERVRAEPLGPVRR